MNISNSISRIIFLITIIMVFSLLYAKYHEDSSKLSFSQIIPIDVQEKIKQDFSKDPKTSEYIKESHSVEIYEINCNQKTNCIELHANVYTNIKGSKGDLIRFIVDKDKNGNYYLKIVEF